MATYDDLIGSNRIRLFTTIDLNGACPYVEGLRQVAGDDDLIGPTRIFFSAAVDLIGACPGVEGLR